MPDDVQPALLTHLAKRYAHLKRSLVRVLGNDDLAGDALHDTYLRLQRQEEREAILSPTAYLLRMAVNIAVDMQRRQGRTLSSDEVDLLVELADPAPGPAQVAEDRSELDALRRAMERLPQRRRQIMLLVRWEGLPQAEVAERLGVSVRTVENELKRGHDFCARSLKRQK
ncbi:RNA polymerase sigma factor [Herbaspirillum sp. alder98]|uniref:RNA polymerase sigma factor n=1 Tax=Herbaspirillum sp. alder98 TaxID=2913096 RepID=UPI001CD8F0D5|nr:RNA polymerase sigma factor [Herbaspirillum sp. alder98]MCA1324545.1 RNA polymerase sigma factor [Herbaspirillum sp. alder98]